MLSQKAVNYLKEFPRTGLFIALKLIISAGLSVVFFRVFYLGLKLGLPRPDNFYVNEGLPNYLGWKGGLYSLMVLSFVAFFVSTGMFLKTCFDHFSKK